MCGIFVYHGKGNAADHILKGLKRLEYRGYDSWGVAVFSDKKVHQYKTVGTIPESYPLGVLPKASVGIGHTRWATHGGITTKNSHPHTSSDGHFSLVQNGMVANYAQLKEALLQKGYKFYSQTDTEVIVRLIEEELQSVDSLKDAITSAFQKLEGRNTLAILDSHTGKIYVIKNGSPLVLGINEGGFFAASDTLAIAPHVQKILVLDDFDFAEIGQNSLEIKNIRTNSPRKPLWKGIQDVSYDIGKNGFPHYMLKEIMEQPQTILSAATDSEDTFLPLVRTINKARRVYIIGAGTAGYAAQQIAYYLRRISKVDAVALRSYNYESFVHLANSKDVLIALSQSGETADTMEAVSAFEEKGSTVASLVNMEGTSLARQSQFSFLSRAGPEICVASTKVFTSQCTWGYLLSMILAGKYTEGRRNIEHLSADLIAFLSDELTQQIRNINLLLLEPESTFILGKEENQAIALEAALKIKEISYKHVEGFSSGELKHGVIALIEKGVPVLGIIPSEYGSGGLGDVLGSMEQVKARGALTIGVGDAKASDPTLFDYYISTPQVDLLGPIANVIPFQLISYYLSLELGNNIDKPRNLAKSVTVK